MTNEPSLSIEGERKPLVDIRLCGCWILRAGRGYTVVLCEKHEAPVLEIVRETKEGK